MPERLSIYSHRHFPFLFLAVATLLSYVVLRFWFPLAPYFNQVPLADIRSFTPSIGGGLGYAAWLGFVFASYWLAYRHVRQSTKPPGITHILLATLLFGLALLQTYPVNATDIYRYFIRGRVGSVYGESPFISPPDSFPQDPYLPLAGEWAGETSPYGPVWEMTAAVVTKLFPDSLYTSLLLFKGLGLLAHLVISGLIWKLLDHRQPADRLSRSLLYAWNPAILLTFVVDAHNDAFMLLWLLLGVYVMRRGYPSSGFLLMLLAALTKPIGLLPLPIFFLATWRQLPNTQSRIRFLLLSAFGGLVLAGLAFQPFGSPLALGQRLLREASAGAGFSWTALVILLARRAGSDLSLSLMNQVVTVMFATITFWLLWQTWRRRSPLRGTADIFAAYILQALNFRIWYTVWPFPWLVLDTEDDAHTGWRLHAGLWLLLTAQLSVLAYGHLRVFALGGDYLLAHLVGVPLTFALPLLVARSGWFRRWQQGGLESA